MNPILSQRIESAVVAALVLIGTIELGFSWWWLLVLFLLFDLSMVGYAKDQRWGAAIYNAAHTYIAPAGLFIAYLATEARWAAFLALAWGFHVAVDRSLGYGLKERDDFKHTHLGSLYKAK